MMRQPDRIVLAVLGLFAAATAAPGKDLILSKRAGEYTVEVKLDRNPPVKGDVNAEIGLKDGSDRPVTDPDVLVNYYMPPMPRMPPMNYRTKAKRKKEIYGLKMSFIMEGPWIIAVKITRGEKTVTAKFNIEVR
jgi:hypothetical protein